MTLMIQVMQKPFYNHGFYMADLDLSMLIKINVTIFIYTQFWIACNLFETTQWFAAKGNRIQINAWFQCRQSGARYDECGGNTRQQLIRLTLHRAYFSPLGDYFNCKARSSAVTLLYTEMSVKCLLKIIEFQIKKQSGLSMYLV